MPTGYTCNIHKGITFQEYALTCAKAFGACLSLRDEPSGTPIPDEFYPPTYHKEALTEAYARKSQLHALGLSAANEAAEKEYNSAMQSYKTRLKEAAETKIKFLAMTAQAKAFVPPTAEHQGLKDFMLKQLEISASDYDVSYYKEPVQKTGDEWLKDKLESCQRDIDYHTKNWYEEQECAAHNTQWVKQLRESLNT